jgi:hypothetical protein
LEFQKHVFRPSILDVKVRAIFKACNVEVTTISGSAMLGGDELELEPETAAQLRGGSCRLPSSDDDQPIRSIFTIYSPFSSLFTPFVLVALVVHF